MRSKTLKIYILCIVKVRQFPKCPSFVSTFLYNRKVHYYRTTVSAFFYNVFIQKMISSAFVSETWYCSQRDYKNRREINSSLDLKRYTVGISTWTVSEITCERLSGSIAVDEELILIYFWKKSLAYFVLN